MPYAWDETSEKALLLFVIKNSDFKPSPEIFERAAEKLGGGASANGCSQKFYKLKREAEALVSGQNGSGSAPATPSSKKTKTPTSKGTSGRKRSKKGGADDDNNDDDPVADETPTKAKRAKKEKVTKKEDTAVKDEEVQDGANEEDEKVEDVAEEDGDQD